MLILGINPGSHDSAACVVSDGVVVAAVEEERFTRRKHAMGEMPWNATRYCLGQAEVTLDDIDYVAICWAGPGQPENSVRFFDEAHVQKHEGFYRNKLFPKSYFGTSSLPPMVHVSHHLAHAASAYRCSPFEEAAVLVVDGQGESVSTSIAHGHDGRIKFISQFGIQHSLGYFYQAVTDYLGLGSLSGEGKTMALAAYGDARFDFPEFSLLNDGYSVAAPEPANEDATRAMLEFWQFRLRARFGTHRIPPRTDDRSRPCFLEFGTPEWDIAASSQAQLEHVLIHLASLALRWTSSKNLVLSGGVALNCAANGKIAKATGAELFIFPAAGDAGAAVGAAIEVSAELGAKAARPFRHPFLGPSFTTDAIERILGEEQVPYTVCSDKEVAELIAAGHTVGWFQGRAELGPRALGHRSILADPRSATIRDHVNAVKRRERWRPFAPSVTKEAATELLGRDVISPYMLLAVPVLAAQQERIAAAVHVDGTARPQTVDAVEEPLYHGLLEACRRLIGVAAVLNTSFNDESEPMVCTPREALRTYLSTGLDYLIMGPFAVGPKEHMRKSAP